MLITALWAFLGGLLSFLSPCILPVAPGYLGVLSGSSLQALKEGGAARKRLIFGTLAFIAGFTLVFIVLGLASSALGGLLANSRKLIAQIGGALIIIFGLHQGGWLKLPFLYREHRFHTQKAHGLPGAFLTGLAFSFGWTPCVGPILGSILTLAGSGSSPAGAALLLAIYSAGLGIPFLLLALAFERLLPLFSRFKNSFKYLAWFTGACLILMGILLATGTLDRISQWATMITGGWSADQLLPQP